MSKFTVAQLRAKSNSKAAKATLDDEDNLAVTWANKVAKYSDAHARVTALAEAAASTGYVVDSKRYYISRVAAKAHSLLS